MYQTLRNISKDTMYSLLFTYEDGFSDQIHSRFISCWVKKKEDESVLFHCENDSDVSALYIDVYTGESSFYSDNLINPKFRGIVKKIGENEYYILQIKTYKDEDLHIIRTDMNSELSIRDHNTEIIYDGQSIGYFKAQDIDKLKDKITNITDQYNIDITELETSEESSFRNLYDQKSRSDTTVINVKGIRISSDEDLDYITGVANNN